jgi:5-methyltetrahydropteroyltriglutamate--homocysteine methyltransferase
MPGSIQGHDRIGATHVGSLVRPPDLIDLLLKLQDQMPVPEDVLEKCLRKSVCDVVAEQAACGVDVVSDGEFGKPLSWAQYALTRLGGVEHRADVPRKVGFNIGKDRTEFADFYKEYEPATGSAGMGKQSKMAPGAWTVTSPISYTGNAYLQADIRRLKEAMDASRVAEGFLPVVAPTSAVPTLVDRYYGDEELLLEAVADALATEYQAIIAAGLYLQVDDAYLASMYDVMVPRSSFAEYRTWAERGVQALNRALSGLPQDRIRYHVCWGSWNGPHSNDVNLRDIVDLILNVNAGAYALEMANPRHEHEWRVWEKVRLPPGKRLIPGVVTHSTNIVEHPELVAERLTRLARLVGRENVIAGTDCGFAQGPFTRRVHPSVQWAKLRTLAEGARLASAELWGTT